jgi:hypothetical protein
MFVILILTGSKNKRFPFGTKFFESGFDFLFFRTYHDKYPE